MRMVREVEDWLYGRVERRRATEKEKVGGGGIQVAEERIRTRLVMVVDLVFRLIRLASSLVVMGDPGSEMVFGWMLGVERKVGWSTWRELRSRELRRRKRPTTRQNDSSCRPLAPSAFRLPHRRPEYHD